MNHLIQQGQSTVLGYQQMERRGDPWKRIKVAQHYRLIGPTMEQPQYNLFERNKMENEFLRIFKTVGLGTTIPDPLAFGLIIGKYNDSIPKGNRFALEGFDWLKRALGHGRKVKSESWSELAEETGCLTTAPKASPGASKTNVKLRLS